MAMPYYIPCLLHKKPLHFVSALHSSCCILRWRGWGLERQRRWLDSSSIGAIVRWQHGHAQVPCAQTCRPILVDHPLSTCSLPRLNQLRHLSNGGSRGIYVCVWVCDVDGRWVIQCSRRISLVPIYRPKPRNNAADVGEI